jgi:hypothetical protein
MFSVWELSLLPLSLLAVSFFVKEYPAHFLTNKDIVSA